LCITLTKKKENKWNISKNEPPSNSTGQLPKILNTYDILSGTRKGRFIKYVRGIFQVLNILYA